MIDLTLPLYSLNITNSNLPLTRVITPEIRAQLPDESKFLLNNANAFGYTCFIPRTGEWLLPWKTAVAPGYEMPAYEAGYSKTFSEVTDMRAAELKRIINETGKKFVVFWSGGIDSTCCVTAILKNLSKEELEHVSVAMSPDSMIENPNFFVDHIRPNLKILDSQENKYSDFVEQGYVCIPSDLGDALFGTELGTKMYAQFAEIANKLPTETRKLVEDLYYDVISDSVHYSQYKDLIVAYLNSILAKGKAVLRPGDANFGIMFYDKMVHNINTSNVPIHSLHDFFWWIIFNVKFMHCALRSTYLYSFGENRRKVCEEGVFNWYGSTDYQLWSMANNNNGRKICGTRQSSYKTVARDYIYEYDHNDWYYRYKLKIASLPIINFRNWKKHYTDFSSRIGMNSNYDILRIGDPAVDQFIVNSLTNFKG